MIGALWTGISGLASQQTALDNESNNIANVNTIGYKSSRISFADQMYQDSIGKGSKILDAEKLYVQGNLKLTGVDYDMALSGDGFFTVKNTSSTGSGENFYTRAGNFRMGDNGTLQDAAGNEVQGWAMTAIDTDSDVVSTDPNNKTFTGDYTKLLTSKVIQYPTYIETITAKATDYSQSAKSDSEVIFEGAGGKSKAAKISDVEALVSSYSSWLQKVQENPEGGSASSTSQISQIDFQSGEDGLISKEGDQIYLYINGNRVSQNYVSTAASNSFIEEFKGPADGTAKLSVSGNDITIDTVEDLTRYEVEVNGQTVFYDAGVLATEEEILNGLASAAKATGATATVDLATSTITLDSAPTNAASYKSTLEVDYDIAASRIATYRALADKISEITGLKAYMVEEKGADLDKTYNLSTDNNVMLNGTIQIESLIPGESFLISEVGEISGANAETGSYQTSTIAVQGEGIGALESARDALSEAISGKQRDVYTSADLALSDNSSLNDFKYSLTIYDKELEKNIPVPNDNATILQAVDIEITGAESVQDFVDKFNTQAENSSPILSEYVEALNINGNVIIQTKDDNYDVEFSGNLKDTVKEVNQTGTTGTATSTITGSDIDFGNGIDFTYTYDDSSINGDIIITGAKTLADIANEISKVSGLSASVNVSGDIEVVSSSGTFTSSNLTNGITGSVDVAVDRNNDYSGREGAGAEFIEIVNTIDQTTTQSSLQLRLDTLGISDSAFGEFSVDSTGLITMKQDGAEFAIGQVSVALFTNTRGLEPSGDNLLAKTNESGDPIYNMNNDKTAKIEGQTLELSTADLSESLVNLMVFQRAFEANAKSITTSDELLSTLINLKK